MIATTAKHPKHIPNRSKQTAERPVLRMLSPYREPIVLDWAVNGSVGTDPAPKKRPLTNEQAVFLDWQLDETTPDD